MLLRHTLLYLPAQIIAPAAQFAAAVIWTHWMSPEAYGVLTFLVAGQELIFVLCLHWWSSFCLRYFSAFDEEQLATFRKSEATVLAASMTAGMFISVALLAYLRALGDGTLLVATVVYFASRTVGAHFAERARAQERILDYTVAQTAGPVLGFALAFLAVRYLDATPAMALAGFALGQTVAALWLRRRLRVDLSLQWPDRAMLHRALVYGVPIVAAGLLGWISLNGVRIVVQELDGDVGMGLVAVGWSLGQRLASVTAMLVTAAAFPLAVRRLATHSQTDALEQFAVGGTLLFGVVAPSAVGLWQVGPLLVDLIIAEPFRATTLAVLPPAVLAGAIRNLRVHYADQSFLLAERTTLSVFINAAEAVAVILCSVAGYEMRGIAGAVEGCLVATALAAIATFALARIWFGLPLPLYRWSKIAVATTAMGLAVHFAQRFGGGDVARLFLQSIVGIVVYLGTMAVLFARDLRPLGFAGPPEPHVATARR